VLSGALSNVSSSAVSMANTIEGAIRSSLANVNDLLAGLANLIRAAEGVGVQAAAVMN